MNHAVVLTKAGTQRLLLTPEGAGFPPSRERRNFLFLRVPAGSAHRNRHVAKIDVARGHLVPVVAPVAPRFDKVRERRGVGAQHFEIRALGRGDIGRELHKQASMRVKLVVFALIAGVIALIVLTQMAR
jgi:hypothetical protein